MKTRSITRSQLPVTNHYSPLTTLPLWRGFLLILLVHICFALMPAAKAVSPTPDGGYPAGDYNIDIGNFGVAGESGAVRIGTTGVHTTTYLAGIAGQTVGDGGSTCYVDNAGKLGVFLSARRFKTDIADMGNVSEALLAL